MCGRYDLSQSPQVLQLYFRLAEAPAPFSNADVRPTDLAPVIRALEGRRIALPARWGLIPSWSEDEAIAKHTFNARAETVSEKPSFRAAFRHRRCLVPVTAFYEWREIPGEKRKQKLRYADPRGHPLALAGLWDRWRRPDGELLETFTIITTPANALLAPVHERMPAILGRGDWETWLAPEVDNSLLLKAMLAPCPEEWLEEGVA